MKKHYDEEDDDEYGERRIRRKGVRWTFGKIALTGLLYILSIVLVLAGVYPLIEMDFEIKNFANLLFVALHIFYMFSFSAIRKNYQFIFWSASFLLLDASTGLFFFYEDIFI